MYKIKQYTKNPNITLKNKDKYTKPAKFKYYIPTEVRDQ